MLASLMQALCGLIALVHDAARLAAAEDEGSVDKFRETLAPRLEGFIEEHRRQ